ncbi:MAG: NTP transferase domain-containing protein [Lachnospiraceae bacterium]|nr:NTP transferase domain-containing protein [Lachnospiraceae bacterium]
MIEADNALILAAGRSKRMGQLSDDKPKGLFVVGGEVLIERQIRQLLEAGVPAIYITTGYRSEQFAYLEKKWEQVHLIHNPEWEVRNNHSSIWVAREILGNSYVCSSDNYFTVNPFERCVSESYYSAIHADGATGEWCMEEDEEGYVYSVTIGGYDAWYMLGHTFWSKDFSRTFLKILEREYDLPQTKDKLWESIFAEHLDVLKMRIRRYDKSVISEFDTPEELRMFDQNNKEQKGIRAESNE